LLIAAAITQYQCFRERFDYISFPRLQKKSIFLTLVNNGFSSVLLTILDADKAFLERKKNEALCSRICGIDYVFVNWFFSPFFGFPLTQKTKSGVRSLALMDGTQGQYKYFSVVYFVFPEGSEWPLHKSKGPRVNFYLCDRFLTFVYFT
jgi:hypothetical protein